ncbi:hypothetical protein ACFL59_16080 [Planctomycetota bacterium]
MQPRQTRVFVPSTEPQRGWTETLLGKVIRPLVAQHSTSLRWFWFSRYISTLGSGADVGDCDIQSIAAVFKQPVQSGGRPLHRSIRFRYAPSAGSSAAFEADLKAEVNRHGYAVSDCRDYDFLGDLGGDRFVGNEHRTGTEPAKRAELIAKTFMALSEVVLHALVGADTSGRFGIEGNDNKENPEGSSFESLHHMFCNITSPPLSALVYQHPQAAHLSLGTYWSPPPPGVQRITKLPLRF